MQLILSLDGVKDQKVEVNGNDLPPFLTNMVLFPPRSASFGITGSLPPTLTSVSFSQASKCAKLELETLSKLPTSLTSLHVSLTLDLTYESVLLYFGAQLTDIYVPCWPLAWLGLLPRNLLSFAVLSLTHLETHLPSNASIGKSSSANIFEALPASLEHLQLYSYQIPGGVVWSSRCFENLPNLRELFTDDFVFESGVIRSLSRKLTSLFIKLEKLDAVDIPFLPPWLKLCRLGGNIDWSLPGIEHCR